MNRVAFTYEGRREYPNLPAGPLRRSGRSDGRPLTVERVRELLAGCYPKARTVNAARVAKAKARAARWAAVVRELGTVRAAAVRLRCTECRVYSVLAEHGYSVKALTRRAAA